MLNPGIELRTRRDCRPAHKSMAFLYATSAAYTGARCEGCFGRLSEMGLGECGHASLFADLWVPVVYPVHGRVVRADMDHWAPEAPYMANNRIWAPPPAVQLTGWRDLKCDFVWVGSAVFPGRPPRIWLHDEEWALSHWVGIWKLAITGDVCSPTPSYQTYC